MTNDSQVGKTSVGRCYSPGNVILETSSPTARVKRFLVKAPLVAERHRPGHFVIVRVSSDGERIPLTIADSDPVKGTITLIVQAVGASTEKICRLEPGQSFTDIAGPLGTATEIANFGHVVLVGGGVGTAVIYPQAKALKAAGNRVSAIIGGRSKDFVIMEEELSKVCDAVYPCTDDGSHGFHGFVTGRLKDLIASSVEPVTRVVTAGPLLMMKAIADITRGPKISTVASLVTVMVDGTGMCGGCRVTLGKEQKFACVHGPEFDAHLVDFKELVDRLRAYRVHEKIAHVREQREGKHKCRAEAALAEKLLQESAGNA